MKDGTNNLSLEEGVGLIRHFLLRDLEIKGSRLETAAVPASLGGGVGLTGAAGQRPGAPTALEIVAMSGGGGGGGGGSGGGGGGGGGGSSDDYGELDCAENYAPFNGPGDCSVADSQALHIAELQSAALALTHQLTAHGGINRKVFFQQE